MHAWESFGDGAAPDLQAVAKGLGGGYKPFFSYSTDFVYRLVPPAMLLLGLC